MPGSPWREAEGSYGKVAKRFGVTRQEVCHYVTRVKRLPEDLVERVADERDPVRVRRFNLPALLRIARLPTRKEQRGAIVGLMRAPSRAA